MIGVATDSGAQLPADVASRLGIAVAALSVVVDGTPHLEGVDLDADDFWARFEGDRQPSVSTAAPSPGQLLAAWQALADRGASTIVSVHTGSAVSGTLNAARLVVEQAPVAVRLVDTGNASFVVGAAAWAAADAAAAGDDADRVAAVAGRVAAACGNVFVVGTLAWARRGGRLAADASGEADEADGVPVLALDNGEMRTIGRCTEPSQAAARMAEHVLGAGARLRAGVGASDPSSFAVADELAARLDAAGVEVVRYRVGPSVGAHTGPGTAGAVFHPVGVADD